MNSQDANINLKVEIDGVEVKGLLKMQHNNGNVSLSFFKEMETDPNQKPARSSKKYAQMPERVNQLSDFTKIDMNPKDTLRLVLSGSRPNPLKLIFNQEAGVNSFFDYVSQKVHLRHSDCNQCVFLLESLDTTKQEISPFMATVLPAPKDGDATSKTRITLQKIKEIAPKDLVFTFDEAAENKMTKEEYNALFDGEGKIKDDVDFPAVFYNKDVDISCAGELWEILLNPELAKKTREEREKDREEKLDVYRKVKKQWSLTSVKQWNNHTDLRKLVAMLEKDINANSDIFHIKNKGIRILAFNILLTMSYYNWDHSLYTEGLVKFLIPFLTPFVKNIDDAGKRVTTQNDKEVDADVAESEVFWCFFTFYDKNKLFNMVRPTKVPVVKNIFKEVGECLNNKYTNLLKLLYQKRAFSLDFLCDDCNSLFATCFEYPDIRRLWVSLLTWQNSEDFLRVFIIALLFYLSPEFVEMNPLNCEEFVRRFDELKHTIKLSILLSNAKLLMDKPVAKESE